jgi:hypothetical protein
MEFEDAFTTAFTDTVKKEDVTVPRDHGSK